MRISVTSVEEIASRALIGVALLGFVGFVFVVVKHLGAGDGEVNAQQSRQALSRVSVEQTDGQDSGGVDSSDHAATRDEKEIHSIMKTTPGEFLSDIAIALRKGAASELVDLGTEEMQAVFEKWSLAARAKGNMLGLTLALMERMGDGVERYFISVEGTDISGVIVVRQVDGRWHIISAGKPGTENVKTEESMRLWKTLSEKN